MSRLFEEEVGVDEGEEVASGVESKAWGKFGKTNGVWVMFCMEGKMDSWKIKFLEIKVLGIRRSKTLYPLILSG